MTQSYLICNRFLGKKTLHSIEDITLLPPQDPEKKSSGLIAAWNEGERTLRIALAKIRAEKMNKPFDCKSKALPPELIKVAKAATELENPLEAEGFLLKHRLSFLEDLRPINGFSEDYLFYYGIKLKLLLRLRELDATVGKAEYRKLYNSILNGDQPEEI